MGSYNRGFAPSELHLPYEHLGEPHHDEPHRDENSWPPRHVPAALTSVPPQALGLGPEEPFFKISLAEWSLHRALRANKLTNLDFPRVARSEFGIEAVEYVNQFFKDKAKDRAYLNELKTVSKARASAACSSCATAKARLGRSRRRQTHAGGREPSPVGGRGETPGLPLHPRECRHRQQGHLRGTAAAGGRRAARAGQIRRPFRINVIVENHGGLSSNGPWLAGVMKQVNLPQLRHAARFRQLL